MESAAHLEPRDAENLYPYDTLRTLFLNTHERISALGMLPIPRMLM
jgi:hypothetical protein